MNGEVRTLAMIGFGFILGVGLDELATRNVIPTKQGTQPVSAEAKRVEFQLRSDCAEIGRKMEKSAEPWPGGTITALSNYAPRTNRCWIEIVDDRPKYERIGRALYDGQTGDKVAETILSPGHSFGYI